MTGGGKGAGEGEDGDPDAVDGDACPARRLGVAAHREDVAPEACALRDQVEPDHERQQDQQRKRHAAVGRQHRVGAEDRGRDHHQPADVGDQPVLDQLCRGPATAPNYEVDHQEDDHRRGQRPAELGREELAGELVDSGVVDVDGPGLAEHAQLQLI